MFHQEKFSLRSDDTNQLLVSVSGILSELSSILTNLLSSEGKLREGNCWNTNDIDDQEIFMCLITSFDDCYQF